MKKKTELEADLDPTGTRHTRPGGKAADSALANAKAPAKSRKKSSETTRPGATAAARAVEASKAKPRKTR
jgi:hypothetical protein